MKNLILLAVQGAGKGTLAKALKEKYGYKRVANIVTFSTLSSKQALRDCAKVLGLSKIDVDNALSATSENPVQNKVINTALTNKLDINAFDVGYGY